MEINKNPEKIKNLFDEISKHYDLINNIISLGTHYLIKICAVKNLNPKNNSQFLDLACGSGDITKIVSKYYPKVSILGLDSSDKMLNIAKNKNPDKKFITGDVLNLPFEENKFDYITITFGLRNIENRKKALSEIYRVLKDDGLFLHLDFGENNFLSKTFDMFTLLISKLLGKNRKNYEYLIASKNDYPKPNDLIEEFKNAGFTFVSKKYFIFKTISYQIMKK